MCSGSGTGSGVYTDSPGSSTETSQNTTLLGSAYEYTETSGVDINVIGSGTSSGSGGYTTSSAMPPTNDGEALPALGSKGDYPAVSENMTGKDLDSNNITTEIHQRQI